MSGPRAGRLHKQQLNTDGSGGGDDKFRKNVGDSFFMHNAEISLSSSLNVTAGEIISRLDCAGCCPSMAVTPVSAPSTTSAWPKMQSPNSAVIIDDCFNQSWPDVITRSSAVPD